MTDPDADPRIPEPVSAPALPDFEYAHLDGRERIGRGGDADVYRSSVTHDGERHWVAVKEPRFDGTVHSHLLETFHDEAETWSALDDHPNVVTVHAWDTTPVPWIALEYAGAGTLAGRLGGVDPAEALWVGGRVADGIRHGHRRGVAHLDVKPSNVLLFETGPGTWDYPKVTDWGLAEHLLDRSGSVGGFSPRYAAPEQFDAERFGDPDDYTDVYQLGALVYALLTGRPPFEGGDAPVTRERLHGRPEPPSAVVPALPPAVDDAVLRALAPAKADRYETVVGFRKELDRLFEAVASGTDGAASGTGAPGGGPAPSAPTDPDDGGTGSATPTRRTALGVLGAGVLGLGGWWLSTDDGATGPAPSPDGSTGDPSSASADATDGATGGDATTTPRGTATRTATPGADPVSASVATDQLTSRWPLRSGFRDAVGDNHAEARRGEAAFGQFDGRPAAAFDGSVGVIVSSGAHAELSILSPDHGPGTVATWVYFDRPTGARDADGTSPIHHLFRKDAEYNLSARPADAAGAVELTFTVSGQSGSRYATVDRTDDDLVVSTREWHHVAFVAVPNGSLTAYVDGARRFHDDGMDAASPTNSSYWAQETIGSWYGTESPAWYDLLVGKLADLRIYGTALSGDQVSRLYANTS
ncbi:protein kinase domain-containing protein [Haloplanus halophilus]|uniref:protein kinase domain-containing protein n=1 Tax=Haloplanus halophilus TaxID=2949993 RepID=UPI00203F720A|nr:protein kinase [Haloplanus sp. GDY1]